MRIIFNNIKMVSSRSEMSSLDGIDERLWALFNGVMSFRVSKNTVNFLTISEDLSAS